MVPSGGSEGKSVPGLSSSSLVAEIPAIPCLLAESLQFLSVVTWLLPCGSSVAV